MSQARHFGKYAPAPGMARRFARAPGFTLVELMVSVGILMLALITVAGVFSMSSEAAGRTAAHAELLKSSAALHQRLTDNLTKIVPGLLIIESPPPTLARAETPEGPRYYRLRHDRLVFVASQGGEGAFESVTDPTRGTPAFPNRAPAASPDALVYFGPGIPVLGDGTSAGVQRDFADDNIGLTASEWVFLHRAIVLLPSFTAADHPNWATSTGGPRHMGQVFTDSVLFPAGMLGGSKLDEDFPEFFDGRMDAVVSDPSPAGLQATGQALVSFIEGHTITNVDFQPMFHGLEPDARALWEPSLSPVSVSYLDENDADYFLRTGSTFLPRLADFRIEWTDGGRVDPLGPDGIANTGDEDFRTRWFGLAPSPPSVDATNVPDLANPNDLRFQARMRGFAAAANPSNPNPNNPDNNNLATASFLDRIEWSPFGVTPNVDARYRAVWRGSDYQQHRPKALRFSYRLYDANARLSLATSLDLNEDGIADPDAATTPFSVTRWGQEFSVVVSLP